MIAVVSLGWILLGVVTILTFPIAGLLHWISPSPGSSGFYEHEGWPSDPSDAPTKGA
jgi:hypothetical protein